jgi:hypothetical protein
MASAETRPVSRRRIIGAMITLVLAGTAAYYGVQSRRYAQQVQAWTVAEPTRFAVDLSHAGRVDAPFVQTCQVSHREVIQLKISGAPDQASPLLSGLKGRVEIVGADGKDVLSVDFPDAQLLESWQPGEAIDLAYFHPFEVGQYTLRLDVIEPAPALAERSQEVIARYQLCGLEVMPAIIAAGVSIVTGLPALVIGTFTVIGLARYGWRAAPKA